MATTAIGLADFAVAFRVRRWPTLESIFLTITGRVGKAVVITGCGKGSRLPHFLPL